MDRDRGQKIRLTMVVILLGVICLFPVQIIANQGGKEHKPAWPLWQHDAQHTGRSSYKGPDVPKVKWVFNARFSGWLSYPLIGPTGTIYIVSGYEYPYRSLLSLSPEGVIKWEMDPRNCDFTSPPGMSSNGTIYFGCDRYLYAVSLQGTKIWRTKIVKEKYEDLRTPPLIGSEGTIYIADTGGILHAIKPNGKEEWSRKGGGRNSFPALSQEGTIYVSAEMERETYLLALNPQGELKWKFKPTYGKAGSPTIAKDGTIYISFGSNLYAVNPNGASKWLVGGIAGTPSIGPKGTVFLPPYTLNPDGTRKWSWVFHSSNSPIVDVKGVSYIRVLQGKKSYIYAIKSDGTVKWRLPTAEVDPLAIASDGTIYAVGRDNLYAIGESSSEQGK